MRGPDQLTGLPSPTVKTHTTQPKGSSRSCTNSTTYTLRTTDALEDYATVHWPRHISSLRAFGVTTHGIWTQHDPDAHRLVALISYPNGADPTEVTTAYMASPGFVADMDGFDVDNIVNVSEILLDPAAASPLVWLDLDQRASLRRLSLVRADVPTARGMVGDDARRRLARAL